MSFDLRKEDLADAEILYAECIDGTAHVVLEDGQHDLYEVLAARGWPLPEQWTPEITNARTLIGRADVDNALKTVLRDREGKKS